MQAYSPVCARTATGAVNGNTIFVNRYAQSASRQMSFFITTIIRKEDGRIFGKWGGLWNVLSKRNTKSGIGVGVEVWGKRYERYCRARVGD